MKTDTYKNYLKVSFITVIATLGAGCLGGGVNYRDSIASLRDQEVVIDEPIIEDSLEKAMSAYKQFLLEMPEDAAASPEAMRRLADLQLEKGSGTYEFVKQVRRDRELGADGKLIAGAPKAAPKKFFSAAGGEQSSADFEVLFPGNAEKTVIKGREGSAAVDSPIVAAMQKNNDKPQQPGESDKDFERRTTGVTTLAANAGSDIPGAEAAADTEQAINLYKTLLEKYPNYDRNDEVLYQLARAYEETGRQDEAMVILDRIVKTYPNTRHIDETQFRRGEIFFVRSKFLDAEKAYGEVIKIGQVSAYYDQSLFKRGWSLFKQSMYAEALDDFVVLLDMKTASGYHLNPEANKTEYQRVDDTLRVMSLTFSYIGGPSSIVEYFQTRGPRSYEDLVYASLADHFLEKRRYADAAESYLTFINQYPMHEKAPAFHMNTIDVYIKGRFPILIIDTKRDFAARYAINGDYWRQHDIKKSPDILAFIKTNLNDLAKHYHALSQRAGKPEERQAAYVEAARWYREFLASFPQDVQAPAMNFLLAELFYENKAYREASVEYERTAYAYPAHEKSAEAGYAAIIAFRDYEKVVPVHQQANAHNEMIRSSLQFGDTFPTHPEAPAVLTNAAENLYALKEYDRAIDVADKVVKDHPKADAKLLMANWIVIAHSKFELARYDEAEASYKSVLDLLPKDDQRRLIVVDNYAASIYKQAEVLKDKGEIDKAVDNFMRIGQLAPDSKIRPNAEYDAAVILITAEKWDRATVVLSGFRQQFASHKLQFDVTTKLAYVYQKNGKLAEAALEYDRIAEQAVEPAVKKEAMTLSAEFYEKAGQLDTAISRYERFVKNYPKPVEDAVEARYHIAQLYQKTGKTNNYTDMLKEIVRVDKTAGSERTDRTKYLAAKSAFVLNEPILQVFKESPLKEPFQKTLAVKKEKMQKAIKAYSELTEYGVAEVIAAATYQIAGIYYQFSVDLLNSERPKNLDELELEQYQLVLEEQAYPFEEKAIAVYEKNLELLSTGIFNGWIDKSIEQLGKLLPVRYAKQEAGENFVNAIY
ncbi:MAG: tetratricopeptide repeat protein [Gammaproteobacteria bacterium]|nr:tetratricopeptide repeat protein [Gammaproteobacteria bacterium]